MRWEAKGVTYLDVAADGLLKRQASVSNADRRPGCADGRDDDRAAQRRGRQEHRPRLRGQPFLLA